MAKASSYYVAEFPEFHPSLVVEAELESTLCHVRVDREGDQVVLEELQHVAVRFPQEFDPGGQQHTIRPFLGALTTHRAKQEAGRTRGGQNCWLGALKCSTLGM